MKLTIKILKEMIRKELKEARDPLEKKGGYFGRGLAMDPDTLKREKEFKDKIDAEERKERDSIYRAILSTIDDEYDYLAYPDEISKKDVVDYLKQGIMNIENYFNDEEIYEQYLKAVEEYDQMY